MPTAPALRTLTRILFAALLAASPGLASAGSETLGRARQPVVYGDDDRVEVYETTNATLRQRAERSLVAFVGARRVEYSSNTEVALLGPTLEDAYFTCSGERFAEQPTVAHCTGTLIDDDLVLTAGHCMGASAEIAQAECGQVAFVFGYHYEGPSQLVRLTHTDVFRCRRLVVWARGGDFREDLEDYAIVQLDRPATPEREVAPISTLPLAVGQRVSVMGFGAGLPAKIDEGAEITDVTSYRHYFGATTDTFGGNSGSPVFDEQGMLIGLHTRGQPDWENDSACQRVARPESGYEDQQRVADPVEALCESGWPSLRLCDIAPTCGDQVCSPGESSQSCLTDCPLPVCGDGYCEAQEPVECSEDCAGPEVPEGWICPAEYYLDHDGCDCDCGARDPDCDDPSQRVLYCSTGQSCNAEGQCDDGRGRRSGGPLLCQASLRQGELAPGASHGWLLWLIGGVLGCFGVRRALSRLAPLQ